MNIFADPVMGIMGLGPTELVVIMLILLLLFGGSKLPGLAKGLGQSIKEFRKASKDEVERPEETPPAKKPESSSSSSSS